MQLPQFRRPSGRQTYPSGSARIGTNPGTAVRRRNLEYRLSDVETDCRDRLHTWLPITATAPAAIHFNGTYASMGEPSTASIAEQGDAPAALSLHTGHIQNAWIN